MWKPTIAIVVLAGFLTSCGGNRHDLHREFPAPAGRSLATVTLGVGESVKVLQHTNQVGMVGGYIEGVHIEDPAIAAVRYGTDGRGDRFDPMVRVVGLRPGTTRAAYGNRLGSPPKFVDPESGRLQSRAFLIHVTEPGFATAP